MLRVLIIDNDLLVGAVVQMLLAAVASLDIIGISPHAPSDLVQHIDQYQPNVIIVEETSRFVVPIKLYQLFRETPHLRIIVVSANSDMVQIYGKQEILVTDPAQFVNIVLNR